MGGKQKQRTKGNVKASSSARAAQVLETMGGFQGFGALGGDLGFVPVAQATDDPDSSVDSDFRMLLRKLTKKDTTTKVKALQDITSLCSEKSVDDIKSVLPFWPRIYTRLSIDHERRVREGTQLAHKELVSHVGRDMAPYLKTIMGPWLVARGDPYGPAASAASAAFTEAFSAHKQKDVLLFCKKDIMNHIEDNILKQTAETLSDKSSTESEEMQSKYERTVGSSLSAWKMLLLTVPPQTDLLPLYTHILKQQSFWKLAAHQAELIRSCFYSLLSGLCQVHPDLVCDEFADKVCTSTLYKLDETSRLVTPALWEATLYTVSVVKDWYQKINPKKGFLPKLFKTLSIAGEGSCQIIFPNILPLFSKLPEEVISSNDTNFLEKYCESIKKSLLTEGEAKNQKNIDSIVASFVECVRFCVVKNVQSGHQTTLAFLTDKLGEILKASVADTCPCLSDSPLYLDIGSLVWYLDKQVKESSENSQLKKTSSDIWVTIDDTCMATVLETPSQDNDGVLKRVGDLIIALDPKKAKVRVTEGEGQTKDDGTENGNHSENICTFSRELFKLVSTICKAAYTEAIENLSEGHLQLLCQLFECYRNSDLLRYLLEVSGDTSVCSKEDSGERLIERVFLPVLQWVAQPDTRQAVISVIAKLVISAQSQHIPGMMEKVLEAAKVDILHLYVLTKELLDSGNSDILAWFSGPVFGSVFVESIVNLCQNVKTLTVKREGLKTDDRLKLFQLIVTPREHGGSTLGSDHIDQIVEEAHALLPSEELSDQTDTVLCNNCTALACELARNIFLSDKFQKPTTEDLLLALFKLDCLTLSQLDVDIRHQVSSTWQEAMKQGLQEGTLTLQTGGTVFKAVALLKEVMSSTNMDTKKLENLCSIGQSLCIGDTSSRHLVFRELLLPFIHPDYWNQQLITSGALPLLTEKPTYSSSSLTGVHNALAAVYFNGKLHQLFGNQTIQTTDLTDDKTAFIDYQMQLCLGLALCKVSQENNACVEDVPSLPGIMAFLNQELGKVLVQEREVLVEISRRLLNLSLCEGGLWVQGLGVMLEKAADRIRYTDLEGILGPVERLCEVESVTLLHTNLVVMAALSQNELQDLIGCTAASIMSLPTEEETAVKGYAAQLSLLTTAVELLSTKGRIESVEQVLKDVTSIVSVIQGWKDQFDGLFLFESSLEDADWSTISFCSQCIRFLCTLVHYAAKWLSPEQWDFVMCGMLSWLQSCQESVNELLSASTVAVHMFGVQAYSLLKQISLAMEQMGTLSSEDSALYPPQLQSEWQEFFSQGAFAIAVPLLIKCADCGHSVSVQVLCAVCDAAGHCPVDNLLHQQLPPKLMATDRSALPDSLQTLVNYFTAMMLLHSQPLQTTAQRLLVKLVPTIATHEETQLSSNKEQEVETYQPPQGLWDTTEMCRESLMIWFAELNVRIGEKWAPGENSEEQFITVAYLQNWMVLLELCRQASPTLRACYASHLRDTGAIDSLLKLLFCTMPKNPVINSTDETIAMMSPTGKASNKSLFAEPMTACVTGSWSVGGVGHMACSLYFRVLEELPALVRQWYNTQDRKVTEITDRFTSKFVSPLLCEKQIAEVRQEIVNTDTLKVKTRPVTREVIAVYTLDDASIELVVTLPPNHPLGPVTVEQGKKIGIANNEWRNWMLQLTTFLQHQNGTIIKGLLLWKRNVDKKFEGVEECYICFSIIHGTTCQLPKLQCRTCKKKFHSSCLYKWFTTSNKATCPLCRNLF